MTIGPIERALLRAHPRAIVHLRERHSARALGLVLGAGVSKAVGFPSWRELVERIARTPDVRGDHLIAAAGDVSETAKTQMLLQHYRTKRLDRLGVPASARTLRKIHGEWRRIVQAALYEGTPGSAAELAAAHPYLSSLVPVVADSPMTITYNFDDTVERLLHLEEPPRENAYGRRFETIWDAALQCRRDVAAIYHPNGYLPSNLLEHPSEHLVFSEDTFADQLIESMAGHHASLLHHLARTTCVFVGLSLQDETLRHLLRQSARINPGQFHYYVSWRSPGQTRDPETEKLIRDANFDVYNLITLFLEDGEIAALGRLLTASAAEFKHAAEEEGVGLRYVYYLTGAIGAGKTTAVSYLGSLLTYEEWTEPRHELLGKPWPELTPAQRDEVDAWILKQFVNKNLALIDKETGIMVVDRPPLDPLSFTASHEVAEKARRMLSAFSPGLSHRRIVPGKVIMLEGLAAEFEARVIGRHKESDATLIQDLQDKLRGIYPGTVGVETSGHSVHHVVKAVARSIHLDDYRSADLHKRLQDISVSGME
ncbi:SIR2 family protein [Methylobacterium sp. B1]|uniref:SIR2 family protein n=1 Tax=Methylobacterium sp. B1 TaxID=91459 RepID=UPI00034DBD39|nr:SIR2 family protein [Methylobacterium sp. B1]